MDNAREVVRIGKLLESMLTLQKVRLATLARAMGITGGNLRRILDGNIELKHRTILDILAYLKVSPLTFFQIAYEDQNESPEVLAGRLARIQSVQGVPDLGFVAKEELREYVKETLRELGVLDILDKRPPTSPSSSPAASDSDLSGGPKRGRPKLRRRTPPAKDTK